MRSASFLVSSPGSVLVPALAGLAVVLATAPGIQAADLSDVQFHGFVSQGYLFTSNNNWYGETQNSGTFEFNEFALNAVARPVDRLRVGVQLFARDLALYGNDEVKIDWAYADYQALQADWGSVGLTVGRFKSTYGLYNEIRDVDMARTPVFLPTTVYNNRLRDVYLALNGIQAYGNLKMHKAGSLDWTAALGSNALDNNGAAATAFTETRAIGKVTNINADNTTALSLTWNTPLEGLRFRGSILDVRNLRGTGTAGIGLTNPVTQGLQNGINQGIQGYYAAVGGAAQPYNLVSLDSSAANFDNVTFEAPHYYSGIVSAEYQVGGLTLATEWMREYAKFNVTSGWQPNVGELNTAINAANPGGVPLAGVAPGQLGSSITGLIPLNNKVQEYRYQLIEGFYFTGAYRFLDKWEIAGGPQIAFADYQNRGLGEHRGWSASIRYDIFSNWLVKAEWQSVRGTQQLYPSENPDGLKYTWNMLALKTTVDF